MQSCNWDSIDVLMQRLLLREAKKPINQHLAATKFQTDPLPKFR